MRIIIYILRRSNRTFTNRGRHIAINVNLDDVIVLYVRPILSAKTNILRFARRITMLLLLCAGWWLLRKRPANYKLERLSANTLQHNNMTCRHTGWDRSEYNITDRDLKVLSVRDGLRDVNTTMSTCTIRVSLTRVNRIVVVPGTLRPSEPPVVTTRGWVIVRYPPLWPLHYTYIVGTPRCLNFDEGNRNGTGLELLVRCRVRCEHFSKTMITTKPTRSRVATRSRRVS